jgi:hypothetical protein
MQGAVHFFINVTVYGQAVVCDPPAVWILPNDPCAVRGVPNNALKKILTPKTEALTGGCRKLHNEELRGFYSSQNIIWVIKSPER